MAALSADILHCCRPCLRRLASRQHRAFTTTRASRKHGPLPVFHETPSEELDGLLATFRSNVFLPAHLIRLQQDLVYKRSNWSLLEGDEPATVRLGDEVLPLRPLDRTHDEPATRPSINRVLALMKESGDWENLPVFLEELKLAGRKLNGATFEKLVRKAVEAGKTALVLQCLKKVETTGLGLWDDCVAREVMRGALAIAIQGEWSQSAVKKAVKFAENVSTLMCDPKHRGPQGHSPSWQPDILGILMQMHAVKAVLFDGAKDETGMVKQYAAMMLKHWDSVELGTGEGDWVEANHNLVTWIPVSHGIRMAMKVFEEQPRLRELLREKEDRELQPLLQKAQQKVEKARSNASKTRGLIMVEELSKHSVEM